MKILIVLLKLFHLELVYIGCKEIMDLVGYHLMLKIGFQVIIHFQKESVININISLHI